MFLSDDRANALNFTSMIDVTDFISSFICISLPTFQPSLDKESFSNYRPISNLSFLSKLTERVVKHRITDHLTANSMFNSFQSAYTKFHSTETTLLALHDD